MKTFVFLICILFFTLGCGPVSSQEDRAPAAYNPIWKAIDEGNLPEARNFVSEGTHLTAVFAEHNKATPLHWAVYRNQMKMAQLFIEGGLSVDVKDGRGATPFHWAVWHQNKEMAEYLVSQKAAVNAVPDTGDSVLVYAIRVENYPIAEFLIQKGIDINRADSWKNFTALHEACRRPKPNKDFIKILLTRKADTNRRDSYKCLPRAYLDGEYPDIQKLFDKYEKPPCKSCLWEDIVCQAYSLF